MTIELELIHRVDNKKYYWFLDCEYIFLNSVDYELESEAVAALRNQSIKWESDWSALKGLTNKEAMEGEIMKDDKIVNMEQGEKLMNNEPTRESEVNQQMSQLYRTIDEISDNLNLLSARLVPVLRQADTVGIDIGTDANLVPLAYQIHSCRIKLARCLQNMQVLLELCEL